MNENKIIECWKENAITWKIDQSGFYSISSILKYCFYARIINMRNHILINTDLGILRSAQASLSKRSEKAVRKNPKNCGKKQLPSRQIENQCDGPGAERMDEVNHGWVGEERRRFFFFGCR